MKKFLLASLLTLLSISANASDFEVNGIFYNITGDNTVEVTRDKEYTGDIVIPNSVTYDSKEYGVTSIGKYAFDSCNSLTSISIPASVAYIENEAFRFCGSLTSITVASDNKVYDSRDNCNAIIRTADGRLIKGSQNTVIPDGVTSIANWAFYRCDNLRSINIPEGITSIGKYAFARCSNLISINLPEGITSIENETFEYCFSLTSINIPTSVTSIGEYAFAECSNLKSISIPKNVRYIGMAAFSCRYLGDIYCYNPAPAGMLYSAFSENLYDKCTLHVPFGTAEAYKEEAYWGKFQKIVEFNPTGVEAVSAGDKVAKEMQIYNLGGVRMAEPQRGLNIINGKKYINAF